MPLMPPFSLLVVLRLQVLEQLVLKYAGCIMLSAAQLLDELMGRDRNLAPDDKRCNVRWDHESVSAAA